MDCTVNGCFIKRFAIEHDLGLNNPAAMRAFWNALCRKDESQIIFCSAAHTGIAMNAAVQFEDTMRTSGLMQAVNVLCNHSLKFSKTL